MNCTNSVNIRKCMRRVRNFSGIISLIFGIFVLIFILCLPLVGIYFDYNTSGSSMEPALTDAVDIRLGPKWVPHENLKVGDIIVFRQEDYQESEGPPGAAYVPVWNKDQTKIQFVPEMESEEKAKEYIWVRHRVIAIRENCLITKGDSNECRDFPAVKFEEYQGKIVWHMNHINWLFKAMYRYGLWGGCLIMFLVSSFFLQRDKKAIE